MKNQQEFHFVWSKHHYHFLYLKLSWSYDIPGWKGIELNSPAVQAGRSYVLTRTWYLNRFPREHRTARLSPFSPRGENTRVFDRGPYSWHRGAFSSSNTVSLWQRTVNPLPTHTLRLRKMSATPINKPVCAQNASHQRRNVIQHFEAKPGTEKSIQEVHTVIGDT